MPYSLNKKYMLRAIELAEKMAGKTFPNPPVGCVIVKNGEIISEAATNIGGSPHAEADAISKVRKGKLKGADLYVTLEPCAHIGKNPACVEAIISAKVSRVFIASKDPYFKVNGKGIETLKAAKIEVIESFCEQEAMEINKYFFTRIQKSRPYITIKIAASIDGKIALSSGASKWITGEEARRHTHELRAKNEGILTGIGTILADDPQLTCRLEGKEKFSPIKFIIDKNLRIPKEAKIFNQGKSYIFSSKTAKNKTNDDIISIAKRRDGRLDLKQIFEEIANLQISSILIEAGQALVSDLIKYNLFDEIHLITAPKILGDDGLSFIGNLGLENVPENQLEIIDSKRLGEDTLTIFKNKN